MFTQTTLAHTMTAHTDADAHDVGAFSSVKSMILIFKIVKIMKALFLILMILIISTIVNKDLSW